jgi:hypothetical protein
MLAFPGKVRRQPVKEGDPGTNYDQDEPDIKGRVRPKRRIKRVKDGRLSGENRGRGEEGAGYHESKGKPGHFHVERPLQMKPDHGIAKGDGKEGGEDNRIHDPVQGEPLEIFEAEKLRAADDAGPIQDLHQPVINPEHKKDDWEDELDQDHAAKTGLDLDAVFVRLFHDGHLSVFRYWIICSSSSSVSTGSGMRSS